MIINHISSLFPYLFIGIRDTCRRILYISEAFRSSFSLSTLSAVTFAMCSKNTFSALWMGQPFLSRNSSCCFLSNSRVLAAMAFCFSATLRAFSLLNNILSRLVSLENTDAKFPQNNSKTSLAQHPLVPHPPVEHVVSVGSVQLAAGGEGLVQLDEGGRPVTGSHTQQPPSLVDLEINTSW